MLTFLTAEALIKRASHVTFDRPQLSHRVLSKFGVLLRADGGSAGCGSEPGGGRRCELENQRRSRRGRERVPLCCEPQRVN